MSLPVPDDRTHIQEGTMNGENSAAVEREGIALLLAALRKDFSAMAHLVGSQSPQEVAQMAMFCALFAAEKCRELEVLRPGVDYDAGLRALALAAAARASRP